MLAVAMTDKHPHAGSYRDRHGKTRWRFRRAGKTLQLPGDPEASATFAAAYRAALEGRPIPKAQIHQMPSAALPCSFKAAYRALRTTSLDWLRMAPETQAAQSKIIETFLTSPVVEGEALTFADTLVSDLRRKHVKAILARKAATPHAAAHLLKMIRKLTGVALDEEWIEYDPTYRVRFRPEYKGWKAWPDWAHDAFKKRWPIGTTPRTAYALAFYFGHRRGDVSNARWSDLDDAGATVTQQKRRRGGKRKTLWIPRLPEFDEALAATTRGESDYILLTQYGKPFSPKALGMRMQEWTAAAGLPTGYTLHGLRKGRGKELAERGATTRQTMSWLGHDDIQHGELYTREAEQRVLVADAAEKLLANRLRQIKGGKE